MPSYFVFNPTYFLPPVLFWSNLNYYFCNFLCVNLNRILTTFNNYWRLRILDIVLLNLINLIISIFKTRMWSWLFFEICFVTKWNIRILCFKILKREREKVKHNLSRFKKRKTRMRLGCYQFQRVLLWFAAFRLGCPATWCVGEASGFQALYTIYHWESFIISPVELFVLNKLDCQNNCSLLVKDINV